ncbi:MAG: hypothetical protein SVZ03_17210 [Spirochaetota bacterium]|nr:hypothetical protein [Spirochaetota bacterium]
MKYLLVGFFIGFILCLLPLWQLKVGIEIYPQWHGRIDAIENIQRSNSPKFINNKIPPIKTNKEFFVLSGTGELITRHNNNGRLISVSGDGEYFVQYEKVGNRIEFLNTHCERFWKIASREYPYVSYNGKFILLMNGDHSRIRIVDYNGKEMGVRRITGRVCTIIAFSKYTDFACIGFLDGSYYLINSEGFIINEEVVPGNSIVKGMAVNSYGNLLVIHYGNNKGDFIRLVNIIKNEIYTISLQHVHLTKTGINISDEGGVTVIDYNRILLLGADGIILNTINIPNKRDGMSNIDCSNGICVTGYTGEDGVAQLLIFRSDGILLFSQVYAGESFVEACVDDSIIFLRGSQGLFCYSYSCQYTQ